jgi:hypothetical protein
MSEEKLNIDVSQKEGDILDYDPVEDFGAVTSYDTDIWIDEHKAPMNILKPKEIRASDEEENNPVAGIIDGSPLTKWSVRGRDAWVLMDFGRPILLEKVKIDFHMKKNEKRLYEFGIFAVTNELDKGVFEYTSIANNLSNDKEKSKTFEIKNYEVIDEQQGLKHIQTTTSSKILFWFTGTSSKRKRFSIMDITVTGVNISDVYMEPLPDMIVGEPTDNQKNIVSTNESIEVSDDTDTFGGNGIINLPEYTVLKERLDAKENFQGTSLRFDFKGTKPATSIIVGGLLNINSSANDDISWKLEGAQHSDSAPECGRCNDLGLSYDGKQLRFRKETKHPDYTDNLETKAANCGDLRKKWIGVQMVSQVVKIKLNPDDEPTDARRFRLYVDENAKKEDGTLNNNYLLKAEILDIGQFQKTAIINEAPSGGKCQPQTTIRLDELKPSQLKTEGLFLRDIEPDTGIEPPEPPVGTKLPPKLVVTPQMNVTSKGQVLIVDASASTDPDGEIDCYVFKQTGQWLKEERLGLKALTGNDLGKCEVTYPSLSKKPSSTLSLAVTVIDNDKLSKTLPVQFIDKIPYEGEPPVEPPIEPTEGTLDKDGILIPYVMTGKTVALTEGNDHRNGQRYSINHKFENYYLVGYFKIGKGQETLEMKTDGPNHGSCFKLPECCWVETDLSLTNRSVENDGIKRDYKAGQPYFSSEFPHPKNHVAPESAIFPPIDKVPKAGEWIGFAVGAYQEGEFRHIIMRTDTAPFDSNGKPANNWKISADAVDEGQITNPELAKRKMPINFDEGMEAEIRCHGATNHDCEIKLAKVYEIVPPS